MQRLEIKYEWKDRQIYPTAGLAADYKKGGIHYVQTYSIYKR